VYKILIAVFFIYHLCEPAACIGSLGTTRHNLVDGYCMVYIIGDLISVWLTTGNKLKVHLKYDIGRTAIVDEIRRLVYGFSYIVFV